MLLVPPRVRHVTLALRRAPGLVLDADQRALLAGMRAFVRELPQVMQRPLPDAMTHVEPAAARPLPPEPLTRDLADLAALLERDSPLGICLRRSLVRYRYLRQLDLPLVVCFGAKLIKSGQQRNIAGHAWLTLEGRPYYEPSENWQGFTVMYSWPADRAADHPAETPSAEIA